MQLAVHPLTCLPATADQSCSAAPWRAVTRCLQSIHPHQRARWQSTTAHHEPAQVCEEAELQALPDGVGHQHLAAWGDPAPKDVTDVKVAKDAMDMMKAQNYNASRDAKDLKDAEHSNDVSDASDSRAPLQMASPENLSSSRV